MEQRLRHRGAVPLGAAAAGNALNWGTDPNEADVGDLVFFKPDASNGGAGHVGIYLGNGEMVSATNKGITRDNIFTNSYWKNLFVGFGDPPDQWKGQPATNDLISGAAALAGQGQDRGGQRRGRRGSGHVRRLGRGRPLRQRDSWPPPPSTMSRSTSSPDC